MPGSANKPEVLKAPRRRTQSLSLVVVRCDITNCGFTAETTREGARGGAGD